jgi:carbon-monoxide dehydrogenase medium subunit
MRRRHDLAVPDADNGRRVLAVGVEHGPVLVGGHERLIGERKHRGGAVRQMLDRHAERAAHAAGELQIDGVPDGQAVERGQRRSVIAAQHDEDFIEARGADLPDRAADERLVAKRQQELLGPHSRRGASRENHTAHQQGTTIREQCRENAVEVVVVESLSLTTRDVASGDVARDDSRAGGERVIPAAFDYLRAHTADEAFAHLQQHGAEARVLAGGQSLIPAMRFRLARPAVLVDINSLNDLSYLRISDQVLAVGAIARDSDIERAPWIGERRWSLIHDVSRVVADPVVRQMGTVVGSLCHNDPAGDWTAAALAARATVVVRGKAGNRRIAIDEFLVDSFATAVGEGEMALGVEFPVPDDRTAGSYQKVERKVGDFATAAAAVQVSLNADGTIRTAGVALSAAGACAMRVDAAEQLLAGQKPSAELIRAASNAAWERSAPQADLRGTVEYKKHLAGVLVARGLRQALARLGGQA